MEFNFKTDKVLTEGTHFISVSITYDKGNDCGYRPVKRGYSVHVQPETRIQCNGYTSVRCLPMHGYRSFLLEVTKKSNKAELQAYELAKNVYRDIIERVESAEGCKIIGEYTI